MAKSAPASFPWMVWSMTSLVLPPPQPRVSGISGRPTFFATFRVLRTSSHFSEMESVTASPFEPASTTKGSGLAAEYYLVYVAPFSCGFNFAI